MAAHTICFSDTYTRKVSGESFRYDAEFTPGREAKWSAKIFLNDDLKGAPSGALVDNSMGADALKQYIIAYVESIIEKGLGIAE